MRCRGAVGQDDTGDPLDAPVGDRGVPSSPHGDPLRTGVDGEPAAAYVTDPVQDIVPSKVFRVEKDGRAVADCCRMNAAMVFIISRQASQLLHHAEYLGWPIVSSPDTVEKC